MIVPSAVMPLNVTLTPAAPTVTRLFARVTVAFVCIPSITKTPSPGAAVGTSGVGRVVLVEEVEVELEVGVDEDEFFLIEGVVVVVVVSSNGCGIVATDA